PSSRRGFARADVRRSADISPAKTVSRRFLRTRRKFSGAAVASRARDSATHISPTSSILTSVATLSLPQRPTSRAAFLSLCEGPREAARPPGNAGSSRIFLPRQRQVTARRLPTNARSGYLPPGRASGVVRCSLVAVLVALEERNPSMRNENASKRLG